MRTSVRTGMRCVVCLYTAYRDCAEYGLLSKPRFRLQLYERRIATVFVRQCLSQPQACRLGISSTALLTRKLTWVARVLPGGVEAEGAAEAQPDCKGCWSDARSSVFVAHRRMWSSAKLMSVKARKWGAFRLRHKRRIQEVDGGVRRGDGRMRRRAAGWRR